MRDERRTAEALAFLTEAKQVLGAICQPSYVDLYNLACAYASLSSFLDAGRAPSTTAEREDLAERAMESLRKSIAAGMNNFALMDRDPDLDSLRTRSDFRALLLESAGRTREAIPHLATLSAANPKDTLLSLRLAVLQAWFGDDKEYAATRSRILAFARGTKEQSIAHRAAMACAIRASADKSELKQLLAHSRKAVQLDRNISSLLSLGIAEYRCGNYAAADEALIAVAESGSNILQSTSTAAIYRAMNLFQQGKVDEARKIVTTVAATMKPVPNDENNPLVGGADHYDLILWLAYKEAKVLIKF